MPRGQKPAPVTLPGTLKFEIISGEPFVQVKHAAKLAGLHPAVLEMGQRLLKKPGVEAGSFQLGTPDMKARAADIELLFVSGLRKVAKLFADGSFRVRSHRAGDKLTFWYDVKA